MSDYSYSNLVELLEQAGVQTSEIAELAEVIDKAVKDMVPMPYARQKYEQLLKLIPALWPCRKKSPACEEDIPNLLEDIQDALVELNDEVIEPLAEKFVVSWEHYNKSKDVLLVKASDFSVNLDDPSGVNLLTLYNSDISFPANLLVNDGESVIAIVARDSEKQHWECEGLGEEPIQYEYANGLSVIKFTVTADTKVVFRYPAYLGLKIKPTGRIAGTIEFISTLSEDPDLQYSTDDGITWHPVSLVDAYYFAEGDTTEFCIKGNNPSGLSIDTDHYLQIQIETEASLSGDIMSLLDDGACETTVIPNDYCFSKLFLYSHQLGPFPLYRLDASNLILSATTLTDYCYAGMFSDSGIYLPPVIEATELADYCCIGMFRKCTRLESAPELKATVVAPHCYQAMFNQCLALTTAPDLPAATLVDSCYAGMFADCVSLASVKCYATDIRILNSTNDWLRNVAQNGDMWVYNDSSLVPPAYWGYGDSGIPTGWTRHNIE